MGNPLFYEIKIFNINTGITTGQFKRDYIDLSDSLLQINFDYIPERVVITIDTFKLKHQLTDFYIQTTDLFNTPCPVVLSKTVIMDDTLLIDLKYTSLLLKK